jgi:hypothetical protein
MIHSTHTRRIAQALGILLAATAISGPAYALSSGGGSGEPQTCNVRPGDVLTDNSCYRWSHGGDRSVASSVRKGAAGSSQVLSENSNYNFQHSEDPR